MLNTHKKVFNDKHFDHLEAVAVSKVPRYPTLGAVGGPFGEPGMVGDIVLDLSGTGPLPALGGPTFYGHTGNTWVPLGGAGAVEPLDITLDAGNFTGGNNILVNIGDAITGEDGAGGALELRGGLGNPLSGNVNIFTPDTTLFAASNSGAINLATGPSVSSGNISIQTGTVNNEEAGTAGNIYINTASGSSTTGGLPSTIGGHIYLLTGTGGGGGGGRSNSSGGNILMVTGDAGPGGILAGAPGGAFTIQTGDGVQGTIGTSQRGGHVYLNVGDVSANPGSATDTPPEFIFQGASGASLNQPSGTVNNSPVHIIHNQHQIPQLTVTFGSSNLSADSGDSAGIILGLDESASATLTFHRAYNSVPSVVITPVDATQITVPIQLTSVTPGGFTVVNNNNFEISQIHYHVIGMTPHS